MLLQWHFVQYDIDHLMICLTESLILMKSTLTKVQHLIAHGYQQDSVATIGWRRQLNLAQTSSLHYCCNNNVAAHEQQLNMLRHNNMDFPLLHQQFNLSVSLFDIRLLDTDDTVYLTSKQIANVTSAANETTASFLGFSINGIFDQLVARKYEIDSTMTQRMTAIDGESVYYTVSKVPSVSTEAEKQNKSSYHIAGACIRRVSDDNKHTLHHTPSSKLYCC
jgi:hypothetical protein